MKQTFATRFFLALIFCAAMLLALAGPAMADEWTWTDANGDKWTYTVFNTSEATITRYDGNAATLAIPDNFRNGETVFSVVSIGASVFSLCTSLTSVTIPSSVTYIGNAAFENCTSLTNAEIRGPVTSINNQTFNGCEKLTSIAIPGTVTSIGDFAFTSTDLTGVTIPSSVTYIGNAAFANCTSLTNAEIRGPVTRISGQTFYGCEKLTSIAIPGTVTSIEDLAFASTDLTGVTIPSSVKTIGDYAFSGCKALSRLEIGHGVETIGDYAFDGCVKLKGVPNGTTGIESLTIPHSVTSIGMCAFYDCKDLWYVYAGKGLKSVGNQAFTGDTKLNTIFYAGTAASWDVLIDKKKEKDKIGDALVKYSQQIDSRTITNEVTVTFNVNGIEATAPAAQTFWAGLTATRPADPFSPNHQFLGWYENAAGTGNGFTFDNTPIMEDTTLYARWKDLAYTVGTQIKGGTGGGIMVKRSPGDAGVAAKANENDRLYAIATPDAGMRLSGLYLLRDAGGVPTAPYKIEPAFTSVAGNVWSFTMPDRNVRVYAVFEEISGPYPVTWEVIGYPDSRLYLYQWRSSTQALYKYDPSTRTYSAIEQATEASAGDRIGLMFDAIVGETVSEDMPDPLPDGYELVGLYLDPSSLPPDRDFTIQTSAFASGRVEYWWESGSSNHKQYGGQEYIFTMPKGAAHVVAVVAQKSGGTVTPPTIPTYRVTYESNGGQGGAMRQDSVRSGTPHTLPDNGFTPPYGHAFKAWDVYDTEYQPGESVYITKDTTIKALWAQTHAVTVNAGTGGTASADVPAAMEGATVTVTATPKSGYELAGIVCDSGQPVTVSGNEGRFTMPARAETVKVTFGMVPISDLSVTVAGKDSLTVDHGQAGSAAYTAAVTASYSGGASRALDADDYALTWSVGDLPEGVTFSGGALSVSETAPVGSHTITISANVSAGGITASASKTVTATVNAPATYAVTVTADPVEGGTASADVSEAIEVYTVTLSATPNPGYRFKEWTTTDVVTFADAKSASTTFKMPGKAVSVRAVFEAVTYTIGYDLGGGTDPGNPKSYTVENLPITLKAPTRSGHDFMGWTGTGLTGATSGVTIQKGSTGNRSYTATWKQNGGGGGPSPDPGPTPGPSPDPGPSPAPGPDEEQDEDPDEDRGKVIDVTITIIEGGDGKPVAIFGLTAGGVPLAGMDLWAWLVPMLGGEELGAFLGTTDIEGRLILDVDDLTLVTGGKAVIPAGTWRIRVALIDAATGKRYAGLSIGTVSLPATSDGDDPNDSDGNGDENGDEKGKGGSGGCSSMSLGALALLAGAGMMIRRKA